MKITTTKWKIGERCAFMNKPLVKDDNYLHVNIVPFETKDEQNECLTNKIKELITCE
jgi:hypothetical protein